MVLSKIGERDGCVVVIDNGDGDDADSNTSNAFNTSSYLGITNTSIKFLLLTSSSKKVE